jgi:hypothetical protein
MMTQPNTISLTRQLGIVHQQWLTGQIRGVVKRLQAHEIEMMLLTLVVVACVASVAYSEHRINKIEKRVNALGSVQNTSRIIYAVPMDPVQGTSKD